LQPSPAACGKFHRRFELLAGGSSRGDAVGHENKFNMSDFNIAYQGTGLVTPQKFIARNRDIERRFAKGYVEAIHAIQTNPTLSKSALAK
jgi:ABC-type nitrate/sulfonate/bicarbonate transport system substrate-binding protein